MHEITDITVQANGLHLAGLRCKTGATHKILCIHGWLDNANSFRPIMPLVSDAEIVAIDLPGHGPARPWTFESSG